MQLSKSGTERDELIAALELNYSALMRHIPKGYASLEAWATDTARIGNSEGAQWDAKAVLGTIHALRLVRSPLL